MAKQTFTVGQVLLASQLTSLQQTAMLGGSASNKTSSYTLVAADAGTAISMTSTSATTITVNTGLFAAGDTVQITNLGSGVSTITAGTATVNSSAALALAQYESGTLDFTSASAAIFIKGAGAAASGGGLTLISETVASANSSISFSSLGSYKQLLLIHSGVAHSTTGSEFAIRLNNSSASVYLGHMTKTNSTTLTSQGFSDTSIRFSGDSNDVSTFGISANYSGAGGSVNGNLLIDNYTSTTKYKSFYGTLGYYQNAGGYHSSAFYDGIFQSTSAITSIDIVRLTGSATLSNEANTTIRLYGVS